MRKGLIILGVLAAFLGSACGLWWLARELNPPVRQSHAILDLSGLIEETDLAAESEAALSDEALMQVVGNLELAKRWGSDAQSALARLRQNNSVRIDGTKMTVTSRDRDLATSQAIAGEIAKVYQERKRVEFIAKRQAEMDSLEAQIQAQRKVVEEKKSVLDALIRLNKGEEFDLFEMPQADD